MKEESFEEKLEHAKEVLEKLNSSDISLNESMSLYKDGLKSLQEASALLENAKLVYEEANVE